MSMRDKIIFIGVAVVAIVIGVLVFLYGNVGTDTPSSASPSLAGYDQSATVSVPFTKLAQGSESSVPMRVNYIITSPDQLDELWGLINATGTPPVVDFNTHAVLAVFAGEQSSSSIAIAKIEDTDARMVSIAITKPGDSCAKKVATTSPYEIVMVATTPLTLTHTDLPPTVSCPN